MSDARNTSNSEIQIIPVCAFTDNYCYLIHRKDSKRTMVIDACEAAPIDAELKRRDLHLELIISTHHHHDHVGGNLELQKQTGAEIWCSLYDLQRVPGATRGLTDGEKTIFDGIETEVMMIPGHTLGQIALWMPNAEAVFVGDTLFSMGCGRIFEGSFAQMYASLQKIAALPPQTKIFFGHEYTLRNGAFAYSVDSENPDIHARINEAAPLVEARKFVAAPTLSEELRVNPFLRAETLERFTELREARNNF
jgi:hydroxyacylglutathione hydrolase